MDRIANPGLDAVLPQVSLQIVSGLGRNHTKMIDMARTARLALEYDIPYIPQQFPVLGCVSGPSQVPVLQVSELRIQDGHPNHIEASVDTLFHAPIFDALPVVTLLTNTFSQAGVVRRDNPPPP